jgi:hypothetical protein
MHVDTVIFSTCSIETSLIEHAPDDLYKLVTHLRSVAKNFRRKALAYDYFVTKIMYFLTQNKILNSIIYSFIYPFTVYRLLLSFCLMLKVFVFLLHI